MHSYHSMRWWQFSYFFNENFRIIKKSVVNFKIFYFIFMEKLHNWNSRLYKNMLHLNTNELFLNFAVVGRTNYQFFCWHYYSSLSRLPVLWIFYLGMKRKIVLWMQSLFWTLNFIKMCPWLKKIHLTTSSKFGFNTIMKNLWLKK